MFVLLRRFLRPYRIRFVVGILLSILVGTISGLHTLVFAPALHLFTGEQTVAVTRFSELNLSNLGPSTLLALGMEPDNSVQIVILVSVTYFLIALMIGFLQTMTQVFILKIRVGLIHDMTYELHHFLIRQPMEYFNQRNVGDFMSRVGNDVREAARGIDASLSGLVVSGFHIFLTSALLAYTDWVLTLGIVCLGGVHLLLSWLLGPKFVKALSQNLKHVGGVNHLMMESFNGIRVVKTMAGERFMDRVIEKQLSKWRKSFYDSSVLRAIDQPLRLVADSLVISAALLMTFFSMHQGRMNLDAAAIYIALCLKLIPPISNFSSGLFRLTGCSAGSSRVLEILEADRVIEDGDRVPDALQKEIHIENLSFSYLEGSPVLYDFSLKIKKGEKLALVGSSGSGKSTLTDLLLRLYDPQQGKITFDGVDIREFQQRAYRRQFGVVNQDCLLFSGTVRENILYGRSMDEDLYERAKKVANCDFIKELPLADESRVGDRGITLSGGQRQRIALARAVFNRPEFLILDEATSALDAESERLVQEGIQRAVKDSTAILIAHRLSTVREANRIVVMDQGRIHAQGSHSELLESSDIYQRLCALQFLPEANDHV
jgi:subfamily B ATP-binding cassette protein MsbA